MAYVHDVSPVTKSKKNVEYFKLKLQEQEQTHEAVSFKPELQETFSDAALTKSPVKITGHRRKANYKDNNIQDVEIGRSAKVILVSNAEFDYTPQHVPVADEISVREIKLGTTANW